MGSISTGASSLVGPITATPGVSGPWRPPQWSQPNTTTPPLTLTATDSNGNPTAYVFDGIIRAEHNQKQVITQNPVQTGAAITDNAYLVPPTVVVEIAMSDSMQSFTVGQFSGGAARSVSAFQTLCNLQATLSPVSLATRLRPYSNMMITEIHAPEDPKTKHALRAIVTFQQIFTANVSQTVVSSSASSNVQSAAPQTTGSNATGQVNTAPVTPSIATQNNIANAPPLP